MHSCPVTTPRPPARRTLTPQPSASPTQSALDNARKSRENERKSEGEGAHSGRDGEVARVAHERGDRPSDRLAVAKVREAVRSR